MSDSVRTRPGFGLGDPHPILAGTPRSGDLKARDRAVAHAAGFDFELTKRRLLM